MTNKNTPKRVQRSRKGGTATGSIRGRPYAIQDVLEAIRTIEGCGQIRCTKEETAAILGVSIEALNSFYKRHPEALEAYERGVHVGAASLRRKQFQMAEKNATMAIYLGMNYLGQKDMRHHDHKHSGTIRVEHTILGDLLGEIDEETRRAERAKLIEHQSGGQQGE